VDASSVIFGKINVPNHSRMVILFEIVKVYIKPGGK
jgi:hypothetical protein